MIRFSPDPHEIGERVDAAVARRGGWPRSAVQAALKRAEIVVSGRAVRPSYRLAQTDTVEGTVLVADDELPGPEALPVTVRYSDDRVLVVSKPAGLVTHPAGGHRSGTLVNALLGLGEPLAMADPSRPGIVHRLDKGTSGLLLVAKDDGARSYLQRALRARRISRDYLALVRGRPPADAGTVEAPVGRHPTRRTKMAVVAGGRPAVTHYRVVASTDRASLLRIGLETGRTHQIRVHLSHIGHPVLGDRAYGGLSELSRALGLERPFLHAHRLVFPHPRDGSPTEVRDQMPPDLSDALKRAGLEAPQG